MHHHLSLTGATKMDVTIIIPAAGLGSRFVEAGYSIPKPLIKARGVPMITRVAGMFPNCDIITVCQREFEEAIGVATLGDTIPITKLTEGAALTVLCAESMVRDNAPVLVVNSDNLIDNGEATKFIDYALATHCDGAIMTFPVDGGPWSYANVRENRVVQVAEKVQISNLATAGLYYFRSWRILRTAVCRMVAANDRYNGEFYLAPVYNYMVGAGMLVMNYEIKAEDFVSLGTPADLEKYNAGS
jgi:dTDP-glucose pyrophosphorylase